MRSASPLGLVFLTSESFSHHSIFNPSSSYLLVLPLMAFFIKAPVYLFHLWLPQAHVQASTLGSVILASVVLKVRTLGLTRFMSHPFLVLRVSKPAVVLVFLGGVIVSLQTLLQLDLKALIAYSRICHIALPTLILLIKLPSSATAATIIILGHGFVSSSMFTFS